MHKKQIIYLLTVVFILFNISCSVKEKDYTQYVDPYIGSGYHGHVFVGASTPFGMVQLGPTNITEGWDWCSGYHYSDSTLVGFAHTHLSGTGSGDLGDILLVPTFSETPAGPYLAYYNHNQEIVEPGYYSVVIVPTQIKAELTATDRVGYHKYTYPKSDMRILMDLNRGIADNVVDGSVKMTGERTFEGFRESKGWARKNKIYFAGEFSESVTKFSNDSTLYASFDFAPNSSNTVDVKVAISYTSVEAAKENLKVETPSWGFEEIRATAKDKWNKELSKVDYIAEELDDMKIFYTALYHSMFAPTIFSDVNGDYLGADQKVYNSNEFTSYSVFSLWDTYRSAHPWYTIVNPERVNDFIKTFLTIYEQQGYLPKWHLVGNETWAMTGYPGIIVLVDAYLKGFRDFDVDLAYEACKATALHKGSYGSNNLLTLDFVPADKVFGSVSRALEYAIADWSVAEFAKELKRESGSNKYDEDIKLFETRAKYYQNYFDKELKFMRPKMSDGTWKEPFDPRKQDGFIEGNSWQYTWMVPHDVEGLAELFGSKEEFISRLDSLFVTSSSPKGYVSVDVTGLIGQYAHGNEPSHSTLYLYSVLGERDKTSKLVRQVMDEFYLAKPEGIIGNEDCGQMSAWYLFSSMGFYPVNGASSLYWFGSPKMQSATINLPNGKKFQIIAHNQSKENIYIKTIKLNGEEYLLPYIKHSDIMNGGKLEYTMTN